MMSPREAHSDGCFAFPTLPFGCSTCTSWQPQEYETCRARASVRLMTTERRQQILHQPSRHRNMGRERHSPLRQSTWSPVPGLEQSAAGGDGKQGSETPWLSGVSRVLMQAGFSLAEPFQKPQLHLFLASSPGSVAAAIGTSVPFRPSLRRQSHLPLLWQWAQLWRGPLDCNVGSGELRSS